MASQSSSKFPESRGHRIFQQIMNRGERRNERSTYRKSDTFRQLIQLREMLKGGQISREDYEAIKFELLNR